MITEDEILKVAPDPVRVARRLIVAAKLLYANAEGCAVNHYGEDFTTHGLPGWLADCAVDIAAAEALGARALAAHLAAGAEQPKTLGPYEARHCVGMPAHVCDYGVVSLSAGREVCRVWEEQDARAIADYLNGRGSPATIASLRAEVEKLRRADQSCQWYWPEGATESENCSDCPQEVVQNVSGWEEPTGEVIAVARGGVVEVSYCAALPPASDADSDDEFWVQEPSMELAAAKIAAERKRRAALAPIPAKEG